AAPVPVTGSLGLGGLRGRARVGLEAVGDRASLRGGRGAGRAALVLLPVLLLRVLRLAGAGRRTRGSLGGGSGTARLPGDHRAEVQLGRGADLFPGLLGVGALGNVDDDVAIALGLD